MWIIDLLSFGHPKYMLWSIKSKLDSNGWWSMVKLFLNCNSLCWSLTDTLFVYFWHLFVYVLELGISGGSKKSRMYFWRFCWIWGTIGFWLPQPQRSIGPPRWKTDFNTARSNIFHGNVLFTIAHLIVSKEFSLSFYTPSVTDKHQSRYLQIKTLDLDFFIITGTILDIRKE